MFSQPEKNIEQFAVDPGMKVVDLGSGAGFYTLFLAEHVGKTGKVTPTAILEPIMIGDKQVSRATLNNPGFIEALDLRIGDKVGVILGGEIIPVIVHKVDG